MILTSLQDFKDLFSTLMVSLKLDTHRVRFTRFDYSFTSEEAINNLGSLKFSQSNRMPDPKDPSRIVTTTTTTTFSMAKEMARSVCQRFVDARFIEPVDGRSVSHFPMKGALFQLTPKGINILQRFCQRNGITARHVMDVLESPRNTMQLVTLERDTETDKISQDRGTIEVIFRRFIGQDGPNIKSSVSSSDSDSVSDYTNGLVGVKMARERKIGDKVYSNTFTGKASIDWLMDCSTTIDRSEACSIAELFVKSG
jgi:Domain found in Dishevelled, Egl-10, and Pleckstrin (DEP).